MKRSKAKARTCPVCQFSTLTEKKFDLHVQESHGTDTGSFYVLHLLSNVRPTCACGCGSDTKWCGWQHGFSSVVKGHNARISSSFSDPVCAAKMAEKREKGYREGKYSVWNKGLTGNDDERIRAMHTKASATVTQRYLDGDAVSWWKSDPEKACAAAEKISATKKENFRIGKTVPWSKGLTKQEDERLQRCSERISASTSRREWGVRFTPEEVREKLSSVNFLMVTDEKEYRSYRAQLLEFECRSCGHKQEKTLRGLVNAPYCSNCNPAPPSKG